MSSTTKIEMKYCTGCGAPADRKTRLHYCPYCGTKDEGRKFCADCGASLSDLPQSELAKAVETATHAPSVGNDVQAPNFLSANARLAKAWCPDCGGEATWVSAYSQWYCYGDQKYVATPMYTEPKKGFLKK